MLTDYALDLLRRHMKSRIAYATYQVGGRDYKTSIQTREILTDGSVAATFVIGGQEEEHDTVTRVELYDYNDRTLALKDEHIVLKDAQEGVLYHFRFAINEQ